MTVVDDADRSLILRPQPLGCFDGPAGLILVGPGEGATELLAELAAGSEPGRWPPAAACLRAVLSGDLAAAVAGLGDDAVSAINRLVLEPREEHLAAARHAAGGDTRLEALVQSAAYIGGLSDEAPSTDGLDGEFAVLAYTVGAARALEFRDSGGAVRRLQAALPHAERAGTVLHARVLALLAERANGTQAIDLYSQSLALLTHSARSDLIAAISLERALIAHQLADQQPHRLLEAARDYQAALVYFTESDHPGEFALANSNLAIAILAMPSSHSADQIRLGVAVQSLRAALAVYTPASDPDRWSSCQMNLANSLQYLPSTHRQQNLEEAVELYEEVLKVRSPAADPLGYGRVLANQANALAHLASFDPAEERYRRARSLFEQAGDADAIGVIDRQLAEITERRQASGEEPIR